MAKSQAVEADSAQAAFKRIGIIAGVIVVLLLVSLLVNLIAKGTGGNERKLIGAILNTAQQKNITGTGVLVQQAQTSSFTANISFAAKDMAMFSLSGKLDGAISSSKFSAPISAIYDAKDKTGYIKGEGLVGALASVASQIGSYKEALDPIAQKLDGKWLELSQKSASSNNCTADLFTAVSKNKDAEKQLTDAYVGNRFIQVTEAKDSGDSTVFTVKTDRLAMSSFTKSLKTKAFFKDIKSCTVAYDPFSTENYTVDQNVQLQKSQDALNSSIKVAVKNNLVVSLKTSQQDQQGVATTDIKLAYDKSVSPISRPIGSVVHYDDIKSDVSTVLELIQQQQQQAAAAQQGTASSPITQQ